MENSEASETFLKAFSVFSDRQNTKDFMLRGIEAYQPICKLIYEGNTQSAGEIILLWEQLYETTRGFIREHLPVDEAYQHIVAVGMLSSMHANAAAELYDQSYEVERYKRNQHHMQIPIKRLVSTSQQHVSDLLSSLGIGGSEKGAGGQQRL